MCRFSSGGVGDERFASATRSSASSCGSDERRSDIIGWRLVLLALSRLVAPPPPLLVPGCSVDVDAWNVDCSVDCCFNVFFASAQQSNTRTENQLTYTAGWQLAFVHR